MRAVKMSLAQVQDEGYHAGGTVHRGEGRWEGLSLKGSWLNVPYEPWHNALKLSYNLGSHYQTCSVQSKEDRKFHYNLHCKVCRTFG